jgi:hypothetical protein
VKVNSNRSFGKIDPTASPLPIDAALAEGYSPEVVVYAERLKGQYYDPNNPDKYSDSFFLEYASREFSICYSYRFGVKKSGLDDVPDPRFSGYSYVEILSMVNNGYNVPKEVIAWAKAQQEADVVDYVVLSEDAENSTASETGEVSNESETNKLRAQAKEQIVKTHKSQKSLNTQKDNLEVLTQKAADITQKQSKILQDNSLGEMENMLKDWKVLDEKQKDGVLSSFEQGIYKKLSQKISTSTKAFKEVEENSRSLNEFLDSIESLRYESSDAINTAQETIDASYNLSNLSNPVNEANRKHTYQTVKSSDTGLLNDILAGVTDDTISYVAEHMGQDLNVSGQSSLEDVSGGLKADISKFADEYISKARYIADFSKNNIDEGNSLKSSKDEPVEEPSAEPSVEPTVAPVKVEEPSAEPSVEPTVVPVEVEEPSAEPSVEPTVAPVEVEEPSAQPSVEPTVISADEDEMFIANEKSLEQRPIQARSMTRGTSELANTTNNTLSENEPVTQTAGVFESNNDDEKITFPAVNQVSEQAENEVNSMKVTLGKRASASESVLPIAVNTPDDSEQNNNLPQAVKNEEVKKVEDTKSVDNQNKEQIKEEKDNGIISDYGKNVNFEAMAWSTFGVNNAATMAMIFTGSFYPFASAMMNLAGASVFDLEDKKSSVDNSANITKKDVANADKELFKQSTDANKTLKAHDKNLKDAQALGEQYISLNEEAANDANAAMENEKSSAKPGEAADSTEAEAILTSYETEKEGVSANIDDIAQKDQKMLAQLNKPINTVQKTIVDSNGTVSDFSKVNDMLSERSGNNGGVAAAALAFGAEWCGLSGIVIATGISEMSNPFTYARGLQNYINGVNALGISLRVVASGAIALIASGKADDRVDANAQSISEMQKTLGKDDKILTNAAKELKKAEKQVPQPPAELDQKPETNTNSDKESSQKAALKESDNQKAADNNLMVASANVQDSEEIVKSAAVTLQNVNPKTETSDSVAKRLTRFNEDSTILANRKNRRVNAVSNVADGRNRK